MNAEGAEHPALSTRHSVRVGCGYDAHRLEKGRRLVLAGVEVPHDFGLAGHSDADVASHAVIDALLGAAALGDIGQHFPSSDASLSGISSLVLLERARDLLLQHGWVPSNVDVTVVAEQPRLASRIPEMRHKLAAALGIPVDGISVKATTTDGIGFPGREEGMAAFAVATIVADGAPHPNAK